MAESSAARTVTHAPDRMAGTVEGRTHAVKKVTAGTVDRLTDLLVGLGPDCDPAERVRSFTLEIGRAHSRFIAAGWTIPSLPPDSGLREMWEEAIGAATHPDVIRTTVQGACAALIERPALRIVKTAHQQVRRVMGTEH